MTRQFDLAAWAQAHGAREGSPGELLMNCPTCGKQKISVNVDKGVWHCWVCEEFEPMPNGQRRAVRGAGGPVALMAHVEGITYRQASSRIGEGYFRRHIVDAMDALPAPSRPPLYSLPMAWPSGVEAYPDLPTGLLGRFAASRRIAPRDVQHFGLRVGTCGRLKDRLVFPVFERGELVYYQARALWEPGERPERYVKALNPSRAEAGGTASSHVLLGLDSARHRREVVVVEGPMDALAVGPSAVCTFGKTISDRQMAKLVDSGVKALLLLWDGPSPGEPDGALPEMLRAARRLAPYFAVRVGRLPAGDPADQAPAELAAVLAAAAPVAAA